MTNRKRMLVSLCIFFVFVDLFLLVKFSFSSELDNVRAAIESRGAKWIAGETAISRLSHEERAKRLGLIEPVFAGKEQAIYPPTFNLRALSEIYTLPPSLDWRNYYGGNYVTPVKNQGSCGSCWAFATTAALESYVLINNNLPSTALDLSEQVLISCSGAGSCGGGGTPAAASFIRDIGLPLEGCYPYIASDGDCTAACENWQSTTYKIGAWTGFAGIGADWIKTFLTLWASCSRF